MRKTIIGLVVVAVIGVVAPRPAAAGGVSVAIGLPGFGLFIGGPPVVYAPPAVVAYGPPVAYAPPYYGYNGYPPPVAYGPPVYAPPVVFGAGFYVPIYGGGYDYHGRGYGYHGGSGYYGGGHHGGGYKYRGGAYASPARHARGYSRIR